MKTTKMTTRLLAPIDALANVPSTIMTLLLMAISVLPCDVSHGEEVVGAGAKLEAARLFTLKVKPLLQEKCFGCHANEADNLRGDYDMRTKESMLAGGETGEIAIVPGHADESVLVHSIEWQYNEMPPKENDRLSEEQIQWVRKWIDAGAPWPTDKQQKEFRIAERSVIENDEGVIVNTSGGTSEQWTYRRYKKEALWAYQPVPTVTEIADATGSGSSLTAAIDFFVNRKIGKTAENVGESIDVAELTDARTLIRRAYFDLHGLPPAPQEVDRFESEYAIDPNTAYTALIDRLLDSPRYGERWAQHWLDVTRYADTGGMSNDYERSNIWRYRDYVIRCFNEDRRYDQFVIEQLAGDELADNSVRKRLGESYPELSEKEITKKIYEHQKNGDYNQSESEQIVATGFLRLGPWDNAMTKEDEARQIYLDDVVNVVGQTFLSTTMRCVKCHDHKFDPIPTRDYYRMYAAFSATQLAERKVPLTKHENVTGMEEGRKHVQKMLDFATAERDKLTTKREKAAKKWFEENNLEYKNHKERQKLPDEEKPPRHVGLDYVEQGKLKVREQDVWIWKRRLERYEPMAQSVFNAGSAPLFWNGARELRIRDNVKRNAKVDNFILTGGALLAQGAPVGPGVLSVTNVPINEVDGDPYRFNDEINGRRLKLARWIASAENPLTSRSIVNRVWQYHFGSGIARNPNNFGGKGAYPTHPDLLNFLAADFIENGWKLKRLHRGIMLSQTYRRSSIHKSPEELSQLDPNNELLAYFPRRRLTAEEVRDAMLSVTGELRHSLGGFPAMPEINMEVALQPRMIQFSLAPAYQPSRTPEERNRRTIYAYRVRGQADPFLELFNQPNPNESCELRDSAAVTPQVFSLLNSDMVTDRSIALAKRIEGETSVAAEQIDRAFELVLHRRPSEAQHQEIHDYLIDMVSYHVSHKTEPVVYPTEITRSLVEEFTGQPFNYREILPRFENYVPDTKPSDVSPELRALADVCLLLFNTNEFIYVD